MDKPLEKSQRKSGFGIIEVLIASALLFVICLAVSHLLTGSQRTMNKSNIQLIGQVLETYLTTLIRNETTRCLSLQGDPNSLACAIECKNCMNAGASCTAPQSASGNCRNYQTGNIYRCLNSTANYPALPAGVTPRNMVLRKSASDYAIFNVTSGNRLTDSGQVCDEAGFAGSLSASTQCRWFATAKYMPDYNDSMRFFLTLRYQPNESDDLLKVTVRAWEIVVPMSELCSSI